MKKIAGIEVIENKTDLLTKIVEWDENWDGEDDEMAINAAVKSWVDAATEEQVSEMIKHPQVTMYGPPARMPIVRRLRAMGVMA